MKLVMQLMDFEHEMAEETRFVVHPDDTEDQVSELMRQCFRSMKKILKERASSESSTDGNKQQDKQYLQ